MSREEPPHQVAGRKRKNQLARQATRSNTQASPTGASIIQLAGRAAESQEPELLLTRPVVVIDRRPADAPSEWAVDMADLLASFSEPVLRDLCLLMGDRLAAPPPAADRQRRLGLLVSLITRESSGAMITSGFYDQQREVQQADGRLWPDSSTLRADFDGDWLRCVEAAMDLAFRSDSRATRDLSHAGWKQSFSRWECERAIVRCALTLGYWPASETDYSLWARAARRLAKQAPGGADPRIPTLRPFRRWGGFAPVLESAKAAAAVASDDQTRLGDT